MWQHLQCCHEESQDDKTSDDASDDDDDASDDDDDASDDDDEPSDENHTNDEENIKIILEMIKKKASKVILNS